VPTVSQNAINQIREPPHGRDRSRLDWEKQQQNREWNVREEERFLAIK
jgi:hypothetical protein